MKIKPECATCIVRQVVDAAKEVSDDDKEQFRIIKSCLNIIAEMYGSEAVAAWMGTTVHRHLKKVSKNPDPYKRLKDTANEIALNYLEKLKDELNLCDKNDNALDRLICKIKLSIAGNVIDFGPYSTDMDITKKIEETLNGELRINHSKELLNDLNDANKILYICDNAGEVVFDKILIEELKNYCEVVVSVKGAPILNDATLEDAKVAGIDKIAKVITSGNDAIGVRLEESSEEFLKEFKDADIIIAKGMGNFESLTEYDIEQPIYYIFKAKCLPIAEIIGVDVGDNILLKNKKM
ncbi:damage-control phosphatase ARMT1 family protein [Methanothermococcus okinawensis]|uniref:Damage-control phosphatase ARMT1-like metal-binding domain-containing protein n=1 Tax=Methanothermococcus okinawensis (strain DSM 14208 / JCM 11175 / IH1) TaxID=647113 RepID=F8AKE8_METOI|nr:DUF89 domain-containing protein [Methanothermococcus okinawensis]AEH06348.1 protein of unknown function DUF89 [Methanothermococcus okinawensis IH1]